MIDRLVTNEEIDRVLRERDETKTAFRNVIARLEDAARSRAFPPKAVKIPYTPWRRMGRTVLLRETRILELSWDGNNIRLDARPFTPSSQAWMAAAPYFYRLFPEVSPAGPPQSR